MSTPDLVRKYQKILDNNGMDHKRVVEVIIEKPNLVGEQMGSICTYATVKLANGEPDYELFVKGALPNLDNMGGDAGSFYQKEPGFFNVVLKDVQEYYMKHSGSKKPLDFFPKCLHADENEIIMENLIKMYGYHLNSKEERQNLEYATMTLDNLAQYHAVTYCIVKDLGGRDEAMEKYTCLNEIMFAAESPFVGMLENAKFTAIEIMNNNNVPGADRAIRTLEKSGKDLTQNLIHTISPNSDHVFHVMNHGDFWNNNMLFLKDPVSGKLKHNVFVDFQIGRIASPSLDVTYFMNTSVKDDLRRDSWKSLLAAYYKKLSATVELLTKRPFPHTFDQLVADFKQKSILGFWMNIFVSIIMEVVATIDPSKVEGDFMEYFQNAITKWIETNPDKARASACRIVEVCDEYEKFMAT